MATRRELRHIERLGQIVGHISQHLPDPIIHERVTRKWMTGIAVQNNFLEDGLHQLIGVLQRTAGKALHREKSLEHDGL